MAEERSKVKIKCEDCGGGLRNHEILAAHEESVDNEDFWWSGDFQICKCCGCDTIRFRRETRFSEDLDIETGTIPSCISIFPEAGEGGRQPLDMDDLPERVNGIYRETIKALNAGALTLAGGGLRAIVEAVCLDQKVTAKNLQDRIDNLAQKGLLAKTQADLLHEERYIGNSALHEIEAPARSDIEDGLQIVESLLNTIYIAPLKADRLKKKRLKKAAEKSKPGGGKHSTP